MLYNFELLAVHNHLDKTPITWFSLLLRIATGCFYNHIAVRIMDATTGQTIGVIEAVWPRVKWWDSYEEWQKYATRTVERFAPRHGRMVAALLLFNLIGKNYGVFDLWQLAKLIYHVIWRGNLAYGWDGVTGTKARPGYQCMELGYTIAGEPNPHLGIPGHLPWHPAFISKGIFKTVKHIGITHGMH